MKKINISVALFFVLIGFAYANPTDTQIQQSANILGVPFEDLKQFVQIYHIRDIPTETIEISVIQLAQELETNQLRTDFIYKGKILKINGYVINNVRRERNNIIITLGNIPYYSIEVYFNESEFSRLININRGQNITIIGNYVESESPYSARINNASIVQVNANDILDLNLFGR